jgi:hypothetical protein
MLARMISATRSTATVALALMIALPARAQQAQSTAMDARWEAWVGCWTPAGSLIRVVGRSAPSIVCVVPTATASATEVLTVSGGKVVDRTRVDTDGQPHAISKDGCTGWQSAKWSPSGRRVYLKSDFTCSAAPVTHVSAVFAMAGSGEWLDVQGMRVGKNDGVHAVRYRETSDPENLPQEITRVLHERTLSKMAAMLAVTEPPSLADVEEASRELDPGVVSTWLVESDKITIEKQPPLNGKQLEQLADHGVPSSVIDVMVALSYPNVLAVNPSSHSVARQSADSAYAPYGYDGSMAPVDPLIGFDRFGYPIYASQSLMTTGCSPWLYSPYALGWNLYSQFACGGYAGYGLTGYPGYGYGNYYDALYGGFYGGYFGGGPIVVPRGSGSGGTSSHGRVVNGKGYRQGSDGSTGTGATASPGTTSSSASAGSGSSASTAPPPAPPRTAVPKKP